MHQWVLPTASTFGTTADKFLNFVLAKIKHTIEAPFSERNAKALAQSSAAISTARTVPEQEMEHNEMSQLYMRRMMTMTNVVTEDGLLINPLYEKPGYVSVVGGGCGKIKNMTLDEAEVFSANHVRSKLDLEQLKDMPPERYSPQTACICRTFGFVNCIDENDVDSLCRFRSCFLRLNIRELKDFDTNTGTLGLQVDNWIVRGSYHNRCTESELSSIQWYNERGDAFRLPQREAQYEYQLVGWYGAASAFAIEDISSLSAEEQMIFMLYVVLLRPFNNVPNAHFPDWMNFGFYACDTLAKSQALQDLFLALVLHSTPLDRITAAYQTSTLPTLFTTLGYDTQNLRFAPPNVQELGIFRFIAEVEHALSGSYCACFQPSAYCPNRPKHETHLSAESEAEYGFHGTNTWERWQLLNFYKAVFAHESFDAAAMLRAKTQGAQALDEYLESLFPEWRRKIVNKVLGGVLLPHLGTTITWEGEKKECRCVVHCVLVPEGLGQCAASHIQELVAHRDAGQLEEGSETVDDGG
ncbi:hypothetical protein E8E13_005930 [Curvularia kusanoi]|uniref:Uncharacterized protein n=1 Tax=Curvularia kusanoi TaxID=90978 RepID=A0A9P4TCS9_CURKU|nr:hypothetical protein E8E13_005930 [Curvularia kusanoi]